MRNIRRISSKYGLRQIVTFFLVFCMFCNPAVLAEVVHTGDLAGAINVGPVITNIDPLLPDTQAMSATDGAVGTFTNFDIAGNLIVNCTQGSTTANALFKVNSTDGTQIYGIFNSDGNIYLQDLRGLLIGSEGQINTNQFIGSTVNIVMSDWQDFITGVTTELRFAKESFEDPTGVMDNQGTITASKVYLIGSQVLNSGTINAPDTLVMAAGEKIYLTHEGSKVLIKVPTDLVTPDPAINKVDIDAGSTINAGQVVLAAGDVFAAAMDVGSLAATANRNITIEGSIDVFNVADSDAVSTVVLDADGDITINDSITARTFANTGNADDDAISTVVIDAGGNVNVNAHVRAQSDISSDSGNPIATVDVDADGDVIMDGGRFSAAAWGSNSDVDLNKAKVDIDAANVILQSGSEITADAQNGLVNTGEIIIKATEDVKVTNSEMYVELHGAESSNNATVDIKADGVVKVKSVEGYAGIKTIATDAENNSSNIKITAGGVEVKSSAGGTSEIRSVADSGATNKADVTITTNGDGEEGNPSGDVKVINNGWYGQGYAGITTLAADGLLKNDATVTIGATGDVEVIARGGGGAEIEAEAVNWLDDIDISGLENIALVDIDADGRVLVKADGGYSGDIWMPSEAEIEAKAHNFLELEFKSAGSFTEDVEPIDITLDGLTNTATIEIDASKVEVLSYGGGVAKISAEASNRWDEDEAPDYPLNLSVDNFNNTATVDITTVAVEDDERYNGDVKIKADDGDYAGVSADAFNGILDVMEPESMDDLPQNLTNLATVTLDTDGEIKVAGYSGEAAVTTYTGWGIDNTSNVGITADDDLKVESESYEGEGAAIIEAIAENGLDNTAGVAIDVVGGDVAVKDTSGDTAKIAAIAQNAFNSNNADIQITATAVESIGEEYIGEGEFGEYIFVEGGNVQVISRDGGHAEISAFAGDTFPDEQAEIDETTNTANVTIRTTGIEVTELVPVEPDYVTVEADPVYKEVVYLVGGNVEVDALDGGESVIQAETINGGTNDSDVLICADGHVEVLGGHDYPDGRNWNDASALIESIAQYGTINDAYTGVSAGTGVEVRAGHSSGVASIASYALYGRLEEYSEKNTATTAVCTDGSVEVVDLCRSGEDASIIAKAENGIENDASVGICADEDVVVAAGIDDMGGDARIKAVAGAFWIDGYDGPATSADADVTVVSHHGRVGVIGESGGAASIEADAYYGYTNTADVGIAAAADGIPVIDDGLEQPVGLEISSIYGYDNLLDEYQVSPGSVFVYSLIDSEARILAQAREGSQSTANTVVCAPSEVIVIAEDGGFSQIKSRAGSGSDPDDAVNSATTQVYASEVYVDVPSPGRGKGIWAWVYDAEGNPHVPGYMLEDYLDPSYNGDYYSLIEHGEIDWTNGESTLVIGDYSQRQGCPDCPPCPECDDEPPIPPPPLFWPAGLPLEREEFAQGGCPALMAWLADEIGVPAEEIEVVVADVFAISTDIQPCDTCARLMNASKILQDTEGTQIAALSQVINEFVATPAPPSPEQMTSIAAAFAEHVGDGTHYAAAGQWIDAIVAYVNIMRTEMGFSATESVAFAQKYLAPVTGNAALNAYVQARLAALGS